MALEVLTIRPPPQGRICLPDRRLDLKASIDDKTYAERHYNNLEEYGYKRGTCQGTTLLRYILKLDKLKSTSN